MGKLIFADDSRLNWVIISLPSYLPVGTEPGSKPETKDGYETLKVYYVLVKAFYTVLS